MRMPSAGVSIDHIPIIEVNKDNLARIWPHLVLSIRNADLIALDLELSGLGTRAAINASSLEDRYAAMREAATTRSVLSLGIALFERRHTKTEKRISYRCQVFNVLTLCSEPFTMEPDALQFLAAHAFDFNRYVSMGMPYHAAHTSTKECSLRSLFDELLSPSVPLALHNGLVDLVFLYAHLYTSPPSTLSAFIADLAELFPGAEVEDAGGAVVVDSKYVAEFLERTPASYLEYVFRRSQRENYMESAEARVHIKCSFGGLAFEAASASERELVNCALPPNFPELSIDESSSEKLCAQFGNHGFCRQGMSCKRTHDVDLVLDLEQYKAEKQRRRRKRRLEAQAGLERSGDREDSASTCSSNTMKGGDSCKQPFSVTGAHRAGVDAFMTGFSILYNCRMNLIKEQRLPKQILNKIPLSGKDRPLLIESSRLVEPSECHRNRFMLVKAARNKITLANSALE